MASASSRRLSVAEVAFYFPFFFFFFQFLWVFLGSGLLVVGPWHPIGPPCSRHAHFLSLFFFCARTPKVRPRWETQTHNFLYWVFSSSCVRPCWSRRNYFIALLFFALPFHLHLTAMFFFGKGYKKIEMRQTCCVRSSTMYKYGLSWKMPINGREWHLERKRGVFVSFPLQSWMKLNAGNQSPGVFIIIPFRVLLLQHVEPAVRCVVVSSGSVIVTGSFFFHRKMKRTKTKCVASAMSISRRSQNNFLRHVALWPEEKYLVTQLRWNEFCFCFFSFHPINKTKLL